MVKHVSQDPATNQLNVGFRINGSRPATGGGHSVPHYCCRAPPALFNFVMQFFLACLNILYILPAALTMPQGGPGCRTGHPGR